MNRTMIIYILGCILKTEGVLMALPCLVALIYHESQGIAYVIVAVLSLIAGMLLTIRKPKDYIIYLKEGCIATSLSWILMGIVGSFPFMIAGEIPSFIDALFETVSGFTTTGASILSDVESLSHCSIMWRSFTHWIGGMGVLVFLLAVVPVSGRNDGFTMHLLRAESPGPNVAKLVPRIRSTAGILYILYIVLTVVDLLLLLAGKMPVLEAVCTAFGTAGTGGFGVKNDSMASYSPYIQNVCTVFMLLFGVNFSCYYLLIMKQVKSVYEDEELRLYVGMVLGSVLLIVINLRGFYGTLEETVRHVFFQVASIVTTTGFATTDFDLWPGFSKSILLCLMVVGACAGSTGGGFKCGRLLLVFKSLRRNIQKMLRPQRIQAVRSNKQVVSEKVLENTNAYLAAYVLIIMFSLLVISIDGFSVGTNFSAVLACFNNIGPGLELVGPTCNFSIYGPLAKIVLIFDMLAGRLEIFPILILLSRDTWRR